MNYWKQNARPWVSFTVLFGGLLSAGILSFISKVEEEVVVINPNSHLAEELSWIND